MLDNKPLDFDLSDGKAPDIKTVAGFLQEYNLIGGLTCVYYPIVNDKSDVDKIFMELLDKQFGIPFKVKVIMQYLEETIEMMRYGLELTDTLKAFIEKEYFNKVSYRRKPQVGELIYLPYAKIMFEIVNVVDAESNFFGNKLVWDLTAKIYRYNQEDKEIMNKLKQGQEIAINSDVEQESNEIYDYPEEKNPFGNY